MTKRRAIALVCFGAMFLVFAWLAASRFFSGSAAKAGIHPSQIGSTVFPSTPMVAGPVNPAKLPLRLRTAATTPAKGAAMADFGRDAYLKGAQVVSSRDTKPGFDGIYHHTVVYHTAMANPWVRVDRTVAREANGKDVVLQENAEVADHILVQLQPGQSSGALQQVVAASGGSISKSLSAPGLFIVQLASPPTVDTVPGVLGKLAAKSAVYKYAEADPIVFAMTAPNDSDFSGQWSLNNTGQTGGTAGDDIKAELAWNIVTTSPHVVVAVLDTGIDFNHPDLAANIWTNPHPGSLSGYTGDLHGWNFVSNNNSPQDDYFHGTHVSGIIGAVGNNGQGVAGVTWSVQIMPLKFLDSTGAGTTSDAINAVYYAVNSGARILSNSWGGGAYTQSLADAISYANSNNALFVAAAGNDGLDNDSTPEYPASYSSANIISVAASDDNDALAYFSNYGNTVSLAAPGVGVLSTLPMTATPAMTSQGLPTGYGQLSGTSMATPHVTGVAALALAQNPSLTVAQLKSLILTRVDPRAGLSGVVQTSGRLDAYNVVNPSYQGSPGQLGINSVAFDDALGYNDGKASPGEIIDLTPAISNTGGQAVNGVSVQIVPQQPAYATVLNNPQSLGTLLPATNSSTGAFRVQLSSNVPVGTTLNFDVQASGTGVSTVHYTSSFVISSPPNYIERAAGFVAGEITPDPVRNLVYLIDQTDSKVLAIDTGLGALAAESSLSATSGATFMAVSPDDSKLYVSLPTAQRIQVFSLPDLTSQGFLPLNFEPDSLAFGTGNRLYVGTLGASGESVYEISPSTGQILQTFTSASFGQFYYPLLRANSSGTRLYVGERGLSGLGNGLMNQFDITGPTASLVSSYNSFQAANLIDFAVDDANARLYVMQGGDYHVDVMSETGSGTFATTWPIIGAYGEATSFVPTGTTVWAASGDSSGGISQYNRSTGAVLNTYAVSNGLSVNSRGLAATVNGRVLYVKASPGNSSNATIGLIGGTSLNLTNPPPVGTTPNLVPGTVTFSDSEGNGDGVANLGEIIDLTPQITNNGGAAATNVSVSVAGDSNSTVLTGSQTIASIAAGATATTANPLRVQISSSAPIGSPVTVTFTVSASGTTQTFTYQMIVEPSQLNGITTSGLTLGECMADRQRDVVYVFDKADMEVLAFDTDAGHITATAALPGTSAVNWLYQDSGSFAESTDGTSLFVAIPQTNTIAEYSLPALTLTASWNYSFSPVSLACDAKGRLYCTTTSSSLGLAQINTTTGTVTASFATSYSIASSTLYQGSGAILRNNSAGTELDVCSSNFIYRFSTTGAGTPSLVSTYTLSNTIVDFRLNETASALQCILSDGKVWTQPLSGGSTTSWQLATTGYGGDAVTVLPNNAGVLAGYNYSPGYIRYFLPASGQPLTDYHLNDNYYTVDPRALVSTPNGKAFYIMSNNVGSGSSPDGYAYKIGVIGGGIDFTPPGPTPIALQSLVVTDPSPGSNDGYVHPGQTVQLAPTFKNFLNIGLTGVTVKLTSGSSYATVQSPSTATFTSVASYATFTPSTNFSVAISSSAPDGTALPLTFTVSYNNGSVQAIPYTLYVSGAPVANTQVNFAIGDVVSDPTRNLAYLVDITDARVLAVDTGAAALSKSVRLFSSPGNGRMALANDASHLYVALPGSNQIEAIALPSLQQSDIINLAFSPCYLACGADGKLYASDTNSTKLYQIDPATGSTLGSFGHAIFNGSLLGTSSDGKTLYDGPVGVSGFISVDYYTLNSSGLPTTGSSYSLNLANLLAIVGDPAYQRIYTASGGNYGVGVINPAGTYNLWPDSSNYAPYGCAVAFLPNGPFVYGGSYGAIRRYNRIDGTPLGDYAVNPVNSTENQSMLPRGMAITNNGRVLFATSAFVGNGGINGYYYYLGLLGSSTLSVTPPAVAPNVYGGTDQTIRLSDASNLSATVSGATGTTISWSVLSGPANVSLNSSSTGTATASFSAPGTYLLQATSTANGLNSSDLVNVTVQPDPSSVSVNAIGPVAVSGVTTGQLLFTRTGTPSGALVVNYTVSGTGRAGTDYAALSGSAAIPAGSASVTVPVTGLATAANNSTVIATVSASSNYAVGVSQSATVVVESANYNASSGNSLGTSTANGTANSALPLTAALLPGSHSGVYYTWYFNGIAIATTTTNTYTVTAPQSGVYNYYAYATDTGTTGSGSINVTVTAAPAQDTPVLPPWGMVGFGLALFLAGLRALARPGRQVA